jgi:hypothetical protein
MLGQRWKWSSGFRQHIAGRNERFANGRQPGCTQRRCTHQYGYYNDDNYNHHDYNNNDNDNDYNDNGRVNFHNYLFDNIVNDVLNNIIVDYDFINDNNACTTRDLCSFNNNHITNYNSFDNNHASARSYSFTHDQRI